MTDLQLTGAATTSDAYTVTDHTIPSGKWAFDSGVTEVFENMLERSIPSYRTMRTLTSELAAYALMNSPASFPTVVDLGASRGGAIAALKSHKNVPPSVEYTALETSAPMLAVLRERFRAERYVQVEECDLKYASNAMQCLQPASVDVILSVLTLMFVPMEHRLRVMQVMHDALRPGGFFLYVEKVLGANALVDDVLTSCYYDMKRSNGYSQDEIDSKRVSLEGVLVPLTVDMHMSMLRAAGFRHVDVYFRHHNFCGMLAIK